MIMNNKVIKYSIHSFRCLSHDRPIASSKASSPLCAIYSLIFQFTASSRPVWSSSIRLNLLPRLPVTSSFYLSFKNVFYKAVPMQD